MKERKKTHLIYLDNKGYAWMEEYGIGAKHPKNAEFYSEVPDNNDKRWIDGKPKQENVQFLTLSPFYPSQRLDVSVEINREPKVMRYENHPAFESCVKYMPLQLLTFRPIPKYIANAIHTIGLCHYQHKEPYKTVEVAADNKFTALELGRNLLNPSQVEHIRHMGYKPNEEFQLHQNKKPKFK